VVQSGDAFTIPRWKEHRFVTDYLNEKENRDFILITDQPHKYTIYDFGAVNFSYANSKSDFLLRRLKYKVVTEILVVQRVSYRSPVAKREILLPVFKLQTLTEKQMTNTYFLRVSKIVV